MEFGHLLSHILGSRALPWVLCSLSFVLSYFRLEQMEAQMLSRKYIIKGKLEHFEVVSSCC